LEKSSSAFRTISEVADELDVPKHVLRFWEAKFTQLRPMKRGGGRRYYRPEDVDLLRGIRWLLYSDGYTIKGVQRILRNNGVRFVKQCWQDGAHAENKQAAMSALKIPDLAEETATQAHEGAWGKSLSRLPDKKQKARDPDAVLSSVVNELEECRDVLRAAMRGEQANG